MERGEDDSSHNRLKLRFDNGLELNLPTAVDVSELEEEPRVFVIEGRNPSTAMLFGGETIYWLTNNGKIERTYHTQRTNEGSDTEYWVTELHQVGAKTVIIYEAGVLCLDESLEVLWGTRKYYNDFSRGIIDGRLRFLRDHDEEWFLNLSDGSSSLGPDEMPPMRSHSVPV
jgi:hypothetical protein